jgi:hypothetical protein
MRAKACRTSGFRHSLVLHRRNCMDFLAALDRSGTIWEVGQRTRFVDEQSAQFSHVHDLRQAREPCVLLVRRHRSAANLDVFCRHKRDGDGRILLSCLWAVPRQLIRFGSLADDDCYPSEGLPWATSRKLNYSQERSSLIFSEFDL